MLLPKTLYYWVLLDDVRVYSHEVVDFDKLLHLAILADVFVRDFMFLELGNVVLLLGGFVLEVSVADGFKVREVVAVQLLSESDRDPLEGFIVAASLARSLHSHVILLKNVMFVIYEFG